MKIGVESAGSRWCRDNAPKVPEVGGEKWRLGLGLAGELYDATKADSTRVTYGHWGFSGVDHQAKVAFGTELAASAAPRYWIPLRLGGLARVGTMSPFVAEPLNI